MYSQTIKRFAAYLRSKSVTPIDDSVSNSLDEFEITAAAIRYNMRKDMLVAVSLVVLAGLALAIGRCISGMF